MFYQNPELIIFDDDQDFEGCLTVNDMPDARGSICSIQ